MTDAALKLRAKALIQTASNAAAQLESTVRELVTMRAWTLLGYENFAEMWKAEAGYNCPSYVKIIAVVALADEGMNTSRTGNTNGHTIAFVSSAIGYAYNHNGSGGGTFAVSSILRQYRHGVPPGKIVAGNAKQGTKRIQEYGNKPLTPTRARPQPKRMGKAYDELVQEGFAIRRSDAEAVMEIARNNNVTKSEIYRQAVAEYLARHRESR